MKIYAFIFVRGGSKGLPGKNIRMLSGRPLLSHSIELAQQMPEIEKVFVSTDDESIARVALKCNATVIERPKELAEDDSSEWMCWQHAIDWVRKNEGDFDIFISLPATSPLRIKQDVESCLLKLDDHTDAVITVTRTNHNPWFNMIYIDQDEYVHVVNNGEVEFIRRQDAPEVYNITTVAYVLRPNFIMQHKKIYEGNIQSVIIPEERAIDIDNEFDFMIADYLSTKK